MSELKRIRQTWTNSFHKTSTVVQVRVFTVHGPHNGVWIQDCTQIDRWWFITDAQVRRAKRTLCPSWRTCTCSNEFGQRDEP